MKIVSSKPIVVRSRSEKKVDKLVIDKDKIEEKKSGSHKSSCGLLVQLLLQSKFTDSEIIKKVLEEYPDRTEKQVQICLCSKRRELWARSWEEPIILRQQRFFTSNQE